MCQISILKCVKLETYAKAFKFYKFKSIEPKKCSNKFKRKFHSHNILNYHSTVSDFDTEAKLLIESNQKYKNLISALKYYNSVKIKQKNDFQINLNNLPHVYARLFNESNSNQNRHLTELSYVTTNDCGNIFSNFLKFIENNQFEAIDRLIKRNSNENSVTRLMFQLMSSALLHYCCLIKNRIGIEYLLKCMNECKINLTRSNVLMLLQYSCETFDFNLLNFVWNLINSDYQNVSITEENFLILLRLYQKSLIIDPSWSGLSNDLTLNHFINLLPKGILIHGIFSKVIEDQNSINSLKEFLHSKLRNEYRNYESIYALMYLQLVRIQIINLAKYMFEKHKAMKISQLTIKQFNDVFIQSSSLLHLYPIEIRRSIAYTDNKLDTDIRDYIESQSIEFDDLPFDLTESKSVFPLLHQRNLFVSLCHHVNERSLLQSIKFYEQGILNPETRNIIFCNQILKCISRCISSVNVNIEIANLTPFQLFGMTKKVIKQMAYFNIKTNTQTIFWLFNISEQCLTELKSKPLSNQSFETRMQLIDFIENIAPFDPSDQNSCYHQNSALINLRLKLLIDHYNRSEEASKLSLYLIRSFRPQPKYSPNVYNLMHKAFEQSYSSAKNLPNAESILLVRKYHTIRHQLSHGGLCELKQFERTFELACQLKERSYINILLKIAKEQSFPLTESIFRTIFHYWENEFQLRLLCQSKLSVRNDVDVLTNQSFIIYFLGLIQQFLVNDYSHNLELIKLLKLGVASNLTSTQILSSIFTNHFKIPINFCQNILIKLFENREWRQFEILLNFICHGYISFESVNSEDFHLCHLWFSTIKFEYDHSIIESLLNIAFSSHQTSAISFLLKFVQSDRIKFKLSKWCRLWLTDESTSTELTDLLQFLERTDWSLNPSLKGMIEHAFQKLKHSSLCGTRRKSHQLPNRSSTRSTGPSAQRINLDQSPISASALHSMHNMNQVHNPQVHQTSSREKDEASDVSSIEESQSNRISIRPSASVRRKPKSLRFDYLSNFKLLKNYELFPFQSNISTRNQIFISNLLRNSMAPLIQKFQIYQKL